MQRILLLGVLAAAFTSTWGFAQDLRGNPKRGEAAYRQHCLRCHGESGNGVGDDARDLVVQPANFHMGKHRAKTDVELFIAIQEGVLFSPMHAWRGKLTEAEIKDLVGYIRFFAPFHPVSWEGRLRLHSGGSSTTER